MRITSGGNVGIRTTNPGAMLQLGTAGATLGTMRMTGNTSGYLQIQPAAAAGSWTMTLPPDAGTSGYVLRTDGNGVTSWVAQSGGGGSPSGTAGAVQFTDGTSFSSNVSNFFWDNTNAALGIGSNNPNGNFSKLFVDTTGMVNAIYGRSSLSYGVKGETASAFAGVFGVSTGTGAGVQGASTSGYSGYFRHNVNDGSNTLPTLVVRQATSQTSDTMQIQNSVGTALVRADASGNLSLGSAAPVSKLYIGSAPTASANYGLVNLGSDPFDGSTAGYFGTSSSSSSSGTYLAINAASGYGGDFANFQQAGASRFRITSNGSITANLGSAQFNYATVLTSATIGGANANENLLALTYGSSDTSVIKNTFTPANDSYAGMSFYNRRTGYTDTKVAAIRGVITDITAGAYKGALTFMTADNAAPAERMRIDRSGNVGIGTTSPLAKLHVVGSVEIDNGPLSIGGSSNSTNYQAEFINDTGDRLFVGMGGSNSGAPWQSTGFIRVNANQPLLFATNYTERMRISAAGNVGIGTTSPNTALDINGAFNARAMAAPAVSPSAQGRIYFDSTSNKFRVSEHGGSYVDLVGSGGISGLTAGRVPFASSATAITDDSNLFWDNTNKRLGIGTSSPTDPLHVQGWGYVSGGFTAGMRVYANNTYTASDPTFTFYNDSDTGFTQISSATNTASIVTGGVERIRVSSSGNVGIGVASPAARLDVTDSSTTTSAIIVPRAGNFTGTNVDGMVRYNTTSTLFEFRQNGSWVNYTTVSDGRLKTNIEPVTNGLDIINQLNPVFYDWDRNNPKASSFEDKHQVGFIAQEVEKVLPEVVNKGADGYRSLEYGKMIAVVVDAVKSLYKRILGIEERQATQERELAFVKASKADKMEVNAKLLKLEAESAAKDKEISALKARLEKIEKALNSK